MYYNHYIGCYHPKVVVFMPKFNKALKLSHTVSKILKIFNFEATSFPGKIVQKFYPSFLKECNRYIKHPRFAITGTNGKTTTSGLLSKILRQSGLYIINNKLGANMPNGIVTSISEGLYSKMKDSKLIEANGCVLECDEAYFSVITNKFNFDYLVITNLFRDQLDRYGEMDIARKKIIKGIELNPDMKIILNADDPVLCEISEHFNYNEDKFIYYGITNVEYIDYEKTSKSPSENIYCTKCNERISYNKRYYAQLGDWYCLCGNKRHNLDISANVIVYPDKNVLDINYKGEKYTFKTDLTGLYNAYNALSAISSALAAGINKDNIEKALDNYRPVFGRHQKIKLKGNRDLTIHLIKNPVGASEVLRGLKGLKNSRMVISINDNYADGKDVSWLWDADFEALKDFQNVIYTTGTRSYDAALRLKHAGFNPILLEVGDNTNKVATAIENSIEELNDNENLTILVTYTGLLDINKNMKKLIRKYGED